MNKASEMLDILLDFDTAQSMDDFGDVLNGENGIIYTRLYQLLTYGIRDSTHPEIA